MQAHKPHDVNALNNFRTNMRTAMDTAELSQRAMADKCGIHFTHVSKILMGHSDPTLPVCDKIADALGCTISDLCEAPEKFSRKLLTAVSK